MIPRLFLDYLPTLNFKLQLHTYPPVRSTLSYLTYSLVPFVIRLDVKLFFTIDHGFFFFAHLGPTKATPHARLVSYSALECQAHSPSLSSHPTHDSRDCSTQKRSYLIQPCETSHLVFTSGLLYHIFPSHPSLIGL